MSRLKDFLEDNSGATAIEYGLIAMGISIAIVGAVNALGTQIAMPLNEATTSIGAAGDGIDGVAANGTSTTTSAN